MTDSKQINTKMPVEERDRAKDAEKPNADRKDRMGEEDKEETDPASKTTGEGPGSLMDTLSDPDVDADSAEEIEEKGEPFEGNHA